MNKLRLHNTVIWLMVLLVGGALHLSAQPISNKPTSQTGPPSPWTIIAAPTPYDSSIKINYIRTREAQGRFLDSANFESANYTQVSEMTEYADGLGRPLQTVIRQMSPDVKDFVKPVFYDDLGRQTHVFLPYVQGYYHTNDGSFKRNPAGEQGTFYSDTSLNPGCYGESSYSTTYFDGSPLNRKIRVLPEGSSWVSGYYSANSIYGSLPGRGNEFLYSLNSVYDSVRVWKIGYDTLSYDASDSTRNIPVSTGFYTAGSLYKIITNNGEGHGATGNGIKVEFKDSEGRTVLTRILSTTSLSYLDTSIGTRHGLETYQVFDDFSQLRFVISPKASSWLYMNGWSFSSSGGRSQVALDLCYRYEYDERGRRIGKRIPGQGWEYTVYDIFDRPVFSQDANMRLSNNWMATLYDDLNRPVTTGIFTFTGGNRSTLQYGLTGQPAAFIRNRVSIGGILNKNFIFLNVPLLTKPTITIIKAIQSVTLKPGFRTAGPALIGIGKSTTNNDSINVTNNPLPVPVDSLVVLSSIYYDDYSAQPNAAYDSTDLSKLDSGNNINFEYVPTVGAQKKVFTKGLITATQVRVLPDPANIAVGDFRSTYSFYDDRGNQVQIQSENYKTGRDVITNRYNFSENVICSYYSHNNPAAGTSGLWKIKTNIEYDHAGRVLKVWKTINDSTADKRLIVNNQYDALGRLKNKTLGSSTGTVIETLDYNYNIRGWLKGINRDYALGVSTNRWFGFDLSYDWGFNNSRLDGNISGVRWRSKGDGERRAFGYLYDDAGRLLTADYSQFDGTSYVDNSTSKFDVTLAENNQAPYTAYDDNGNILSMKTWGLKLNSSPVIDNLQYNYLSNSNQLLNVIDSANDPNTKMGDFRTSATHPAAGSKTTTTVDYTYDLNGNMTRDYNKDIVAGGGGEGVIYNYLNLPARIITPKGTITYVYDAMGNKLEKVIAESGKPNVSNTYIGPFVYENDQLQFFLHEEGRTRFAKKYFLNGDSTYQFIQDYFVKDHLGNVRMVLTEQKDTARYIATMETQYRTKEDALFNNVSLTAYSASLVPGDYPVDTSITNPNNYVAQVNGSGNKIGPSLTLKVMAGDTIDLGAKSLYRPNGSAGGNNSLLSDILLSLAGGIVNAAGEIHGTYAQLSNTGTSPLIGPVNSFLTSRDTSNTTKPRAYVNWISFDEQFNYIGTYPQSGAIQVGDADELTTLAQSNIPINKNGYLYIYISNETQDWNVFFDNLVVNHRTGPLLEESHYYPFGLTIGGISSKAVGRLENRFKFNNGTQFESKEFSDGSGLDLYATDFRSYDPQIGRFHQQDPLGELFENSTPYAFADNNPILLNDPYGLAADTVPYLPPVVVTPPKSPKIEPSKSAGVLPLPVYPVLTPVPPSTPPGVVIPMEPVGPLVEPIGIPGPGVLGTGAIFIAAVLWPNPAGMGSSRVPSYLRPVVPNPWPGHGNDKDNTNPHIVYEFTFVPQKNDPRQSPVLKYGISDEVRYGLDRPENQVAIMKAAFGPTVKYRILTRTLDRQQALDLEKGYVEDHRLQYGYRPRAQTRP